MSNKKLTATGLIAAGILTIFGAFNYANPVPVDAQQIIRIIVNGKTINTDVDPVIINDRTMVPIRAISEGLGMNVEWDEVNRMVIITDPSKPEINEPAIPELGEVSILGNSIASADRLKKLMLANNPYAPAELPELYLEIAEDYGIRGDIAFCQAAKETGWWKYGGLVQPYQNNYCGLGATGSPATGEEDLRGADPSRVRFEAGVHGAIFKTPADGVEAHIQHLYAYATTKPLPAGKSLVDPRFSFITRGLAKTWSDLDGKWAVPGIGYGASILNDYYAKAL